MRSIEELRAEIDEIDREIQTLFEKRMAVAGEIADVKKKSGKAVLDSGREIQLFSSLKSRASDPFLADGITRLYETMLSVSRAYQKERMENEHA